VSAHKPLLATLTRQIHLTIRRRVHADIQAAGFGDLAPAHLYVFQLPGPDGVRPTELAARLNMTKQAMNHLLSGLEARGYIRRVAAAGDGRGKVLQMTARGRDVARVMRESALHLEDEWGKRLGGQKLERLRHELADLADIAGDGENPAPASAAPRLRARTLRAAQRAGGAATPPAT
jgi:DNA-binding MarR family transcriptional regulator